MHDGRRRRLTARAIRASRLTGRPARAHAFPDAHGPRLERGIARRARAGALGRRRGRAWRDDINDIPFTTLLSAQIAEW